MIERDMRQWMGHPYLTTCSQVYKASTFSDHLPLRKVNRPAFIVSQTPVLHIMCWHYIYYTKMCLQEYMFDCYIYIMTLFFSLSWRTSRPVLLYLHYWICGINIGKGINDITIKGMVHLNIIFSYMKFNKICNLDHLAY